MTIENSILNQAAIALGDEKEHADAGVASSISDALRLVPALLSELRIFRAMLRMLTRILIRS